MRCAATGKTRREAVAFSGMASLKTVRHTRIHACRVPRRAKGGCPGRYENSGGKRLGRAGRRATSLQFSVGTSRRDAFPPHSSFSCCLFRAFVPFTVFVVVSETGVPLCPAAGRKRMGDPLHSRHERTSSSGAPGDVTLGTPPRLRLRTHCPCSAHRHCRSMRPRLHGVPEKSQTDFMCAGSGIRGLVQ